MFSIRRMIASLFVGALTLALAAGQAGAASVDPELLAAAKRGLALGLDAAEAQLALVEDGGFEADPGLERALEAIERAIGRYRAKRIAEGDAAEPPGGPLHAREVLTALAGSPSTLAPGRTTSLTRAFKELKSVENKIRAEQNAAERGNSGNEPKDPPGQAEDKENPGNKPPAPPGQSGEIPNPNKPADPGGTAAAGEETTTTGEETTTTTAGEETTTTTAGAETTTTTAAEGPGKADPPGRQDGPPSSTPADTRPSITRP